MLWACPECSGFVLFWSSIVTVALLCYYRVMARKPQIPILKRDKSEYEAFVYAADQDGCSFSLYAWVAMKEKFSRDHGVLPSSVKSFVVPK